MSPAAAPQSGVVFLRDVWVNVLANLVAAAIIYLIGAGAGLLPRQREVLVLSAVLSTFALVFALHVLAIFVVRVRLLVTVGVPLLMAAASLSMPFTFPAPTARHFVVFGFFALISVASAVRLFRRFARRPDADSPTSPVRRRNDRVETLSAQIESRLARFLDARETVGKPSAVVIAEMARIAAEEALKLDGDAIGPDAGPESGKPVPHSRPTV